MINDHSFDNSEMYPGVMLAIVQRRKPLKGFLNIPQEENFLP